MDWLEFLAAGWACSCAPRSKGAGPAADFAAGVLSSVYPELLRRGVALLPNVAVDLAAAFRCAEGMLFAPPPGAAPWMDQSAGVRAYCSLLSGARVVSGLPAMIERARALRAHRKDLPGAGAEGLKAFLETARIGLPAPEVPFSELRRAFRGAPPAVAGGDLRARRPNPAALGWIQRFFEQCSAAQGKGELGLIPEGLDLPASAEQDRAGGSDTLDLYTLQACLDGRQEDDSPAGKGRFQLRIRPRRAMQSATPDVGTFGITRREKLTSVLRSYLARPDFFERYLLHQVLFFQRRDPRHDPRRVLAAFLVEQSEAMRETDPRGRRLASWAAELAVRMLGDVLDITAGAPLLEVRPLIIVHNGESGQNWRGIPARMSRAERSRTPEFANRNGRGAVGVLPRLGQFLPTVFQREPTWQNAGTMPHMDARDTALTGTARLLLSSVLPYEKEDGQRSFDLFSMVVFSPPGAAIPAALRSVQSHLGRSFVLHHCQWAAGRPTWKTTPGLGSSAGGDEEDLPKRFRTDLVQRLEALRD